MWKKPGTGPRSASQNDITIIPLSVSEASGAAAQAGRKLGEGWRWAGFWLKSAAGRDYDMLAYLHLYLSHSVISGFDTNAKRSNKSMSRSA